MTWTDPAGHVFATGENVTAATMNTYIANNLTDIDANMWKKLAGTVLGADTASFDFSSIVQTYRHLRLIGSLRSDRAATSDSVLCAFNNDTTNANYDGEQLFGSAATASGAETLAGLASRAVGAVNGNTAPANTWGSFEALFIDYANTARLKICQWQSTSWRARTTTNVIPSIGMAAWASTAAISRLVLVPQVGANWKAGSSVDLYGIK